ncbi:MAG: hypothetical protein ACRC8G_09995 [Plesiomonas shigelloides]
MLTIELPTGALEAARLFATKPAGILFDAKACCIVATDRLQCFIMPVAASGDLESVLLPPDVAGEALSIEGGFVFTDTGMAECGNVADFPDWRKLYDRIEPDGSAACHDLNLFGRIIEAHMLLGGDPAYIIPMHTGSVVTICEIGDGEAQVLWSQLKPTPVKKYDFA